MSMLEAMKAFCSDVVGMIHQRIYARALAMVRDRDERNRTRQIRRRSGDRSRWAFHICVAIVMLVTVAAGPVDGAGRTVRVGVYQNEPKIFIDANGHASGFFVDLLEEIAAREGWTLVYVPCEWSECLVALEEGQIDLMPDVAYSPERDQKYDFHRIPVTESWSQVYANFHLQINGINDLDGRRVAVLKGSIQQTVFEQYMRGFGFKVTIVPTGSLEEAFNLAANGSADAAIANNFFGNFFYQSYGLIKTPIVFNVVTLHYATAQGRNPDLLQAIDQHLGVWIQEPNSIYYTTLSRWTEKSPVYRVPQSVYWVIGITGGLLVVALGMILLLRSQVRARTRHLEQANTALRESEMRYQLISTVASDYMFSTRLDADGKLVLNWVAGAFETITGYTFEEYIARGGWRAALHPDDLAIDDRDMEKLRANQLAISEIRTLTKNGKTVWVRVYAHPVLDAERNELTGIYGAVQDITERKRAEEILEASERRLSLIFDTAGDVLFLLSVEPEDCFRFESVNPAFLALTGLRHEQVIGKRIEEVLPETAHALVINKYQQAIRENRTVRWEEASAYPTGTLDGAVAVTPARNAAGVCTHLIGAVHDITEIRRAEEEIRKLNQELEQRVTERTTQLQAANKALESFSYSVSHDLRAPLRAISGFAEIVARRHRANLNEEGKHYVDNIIQASARMGQLIDDLLQYSRLGRAGVRHDPIALRDVFAPLTSDLAARLKEIGGTLTIPDDLPSVTGDRTLLIQIFLNLLENAITYRKPDVPVQVTVTCQVEGDDVIICVRDNGIGIAPEHHEKIFNVFQRLHSEEEYPGTGIGLATVKKSVELLGGHVGVESEVGKGSTFFVRLPKE
jgi:PAS domain S-box-containing protein